MNSPCFPPDCQTDSADQARTESFGQLHWEGSNKGQIQKTVDNADNVLVRCQVLEERLQAEPPLIQKLLLIVIDEKPLRRQRQAKAGEQLS